MKMKNEKPPIINKNKNKINKRKNKRKSLNK